MRRRRSSPCTASAVDVDAYSSPTTPFDQQVTDWNKEHKAGEASPTPPTATASTATTATTADGCCSAPSLSFRVAKWAILRMVGCVYFVAFLGAWNQNRGLMGTHGLVPCQQYMEHLKESTSSSWQGFRLHPTLFWWIPLTDANMDNAALMGMLLSTLVMCGLNSWIIMLVLWLLDFSIVTLAQGSTSFYSYGWESQLLETGFLAIFLCNLPCIIGRTVVTDKDGTNTKTSWKFVNVWKDDKTSNTEPSSIVLWLFRWLCFRISLGAGLIKVRGSSCWTKKTCLHYHFETQPIPSPLSFVFHFLPNTVLSRAVDLDLWVQLYTCWFVLVPSSSLHWTMLWLRRVGGLVQAGFMVNIALSGNLAFLNHLTIIPALACLDDACCCWPNWLRHWVCQSPRPTSKQEKDPQKEQHDSTHARSVSNNRRRCPAIMTMPSRLLIDVLLLLLIGALSVPVITNLLQWSGSRQVMNASFDTFRLVNTYGAFGSVGEKRFEAIVSVSHDGVEWTELEFPCKPGNVRRRPCFCAPYHYRLDWNIWFLGFPPHRAYLRSRESWVYNLLAKMLDVEAPSSPDDEQPWLQLLDTSSRDFLLERYQSESNQPRYAKVDMYEYQMSEPLWNIVVAKARGKDVFWWERRFKENLIPPLQLNSNKRLEYA